MNEQFSAKCPRCGGFLDDRMAGTNGYGYIPLCGCDSSLPFGTQQALGWICTRCKKSNAPMVRCCDCEEKP